MLNLGSTAGSPFLVPVFNRYLQQNRLLERGRRFASPRSFKTDECLESVLGVLLRAGYANAAEVVYDAIYGRANGTELSTLLAGTE